MLEFAFKKGLLFLKWLSLSRINIPGVFSFGYSSTVTQYTALLLQNGLRFILKSHTSTLLHSFVIFPVSETIFGMSGCFPVSQGQEMKDLIASSGRKATRGCQCSFSAQVRLKNSHECKKLFLSLVK